MKSVLSAMTMLTLVFVLCVAAWQYSLYRQANSPEGLAEARRAADALIAWTALNSRIENLAKDRCEAPVLAVLALNTKKHIEISADIPQQVASDISLCLGRNIMSGYSKDRLSQAGLLKFFDEP